MSGANTALLTHDFAGGFHLISFSLGEKAEMRGRNNPDTSLTLTLSRGERENPRTALTYKNK